MRDQQGATPVIDLGPRWSPLTPIIGYRRDGRPIRLIAGASAGETPPAAPPAGATPPDTPPADPAAPEGDGDAPLGPPGLRALQKERADKEAAEKAARDAQAKVKEYEDRDKTELERATEAAAKAAEDAQTARTESLRYRIAAKNGISDTDADLFLTGADEAAITAQATRYAELKAASTTPPTPTPTPGGPVVPKSGTGGGTESGGTVNAGRELYRASRSTGQQKEASNA